ncbi:MAG TPA: hypothetical protein EYO29_08890 [Gammaproteobacteria bacterium]|nr:hypothetical protein [Gammaproteobacteria bacterium]PHS06188.1 MAG: hypothetical protein COA89_10200 [Acidithiobacillus sp.]PHS07491.1 MAG: hypothetical protein COA89_07345 [Acidithiobacillus sp.]RTZ64805.1 MAG: hypothetical protein DSZ34_05330 [Gammaproteobacteria bacterium]HAD37075.1 hypothetical protein [Gammaproteobacteria bacterium]
MITRQLIVILLLNLAGGVPNLFAGQGIPETLLEQPIFAEDWPARRTTKTVLSLPPVKQLLALFVENPRQQVTIRYPGGDKGNAWALELREWLVALGIPSSYIVLEPGSGGQDRLLLLLEVGDT